MKIIFEKVYNEQLNDHFKNVLSVLLSAFRKHYGCEHVLTKLVEDCKHTLDENQNACLILLDLSKAFDCLPHRLLLCKLRHTVSPMNLVNALNHICIILYQESR